MAIRLEHRIIFCSNETQQLTGSQTQGSLFTTLHLPNNGPNKLQCYITLGWKVLLGKHSSLLGPFVSCEGNDMS